MCLDYSDRDLLSFNPYDRRFICAQSGYSFQEEDMVYIDFFADRVAKHHLEEYLLEVKENVLPSEYEEIIKNIKPETK
jgi:hypothetical protein